MIPSLVRLLWHLADNTAPGQSLGESDLPGVLAAVYGADPAAGAACDGDFRALKAMSCIAGGNGSPVCVGYVGRDFAAQFRAVFADLLTAGSEGEDVGQGGEV